MTTTTKNGKTCRKCDGTGFRPEVAHCDGGRCWHCNPLPPKVRTQAQIDDDAAFQAFYGPEAEAQRNAARLLRSTARRSARPRFLVGGEVRVIA